MGQIVVRDSAGAVSALAVGDTVAVEDSNTGIIANTMDGIMALVNGDPVSTTEYRYASAALHIGNTIATSMYTRKRASQGKAPLLKVLF